MKKITDNNSTILVPWSLKDILLIFIVSFFVYYISGFVASFILMFFGLDKNSTSLLVSNFFYIIFCCFIFFNVTGRYNRNFLKSLNMNWPNKTYLFFSPVVAVALFWLFNLLPSLSIEPPLGKYIITQLNILIHILTAVVIAPITEEIVWRGYIFPFAQKKMGTTIAVLSITILFALTHLPQLFGAWPILIKILIMSLTCTFARALTNSTLTAILIHFFYNLIVALAFVFKF